jgi:hypothetical protein
LIEPLFFLISVIRVTSGKVLPFRSRRFFAFNFSDPALAEKFLLHVAFPSHVLGRTMMAG